MIKIKNKILGPLILLFYHSYSEGQKLTTDTLVAAPEVVVYGNRLTEFNAGVKILTIDSLTQNQFRQNNLSSLLEQNSTLYIKSYGLGSLSTTSFRGASAEQTSLLWNGFNIQSPMNATLDLALVPVSLIDQVKVQYGGSGAMWGSGSVSGSIHLDNKPVFGKGLSLQYNNGYGSFHSFSDQVSATLSKKNYIISIKGFLNNAKNNFPYINTTEYGSPLIKQSNASLQQYGYMMDNYIKISKRNQLNFRVWQQSSNREIPPTMVVNISDAVQKDWFLRLSSEWQHTRNKTVWNARAAYFDEYLLYQDKFAATNSHNHSICQISEVETKINVFKSGLLNIGINNTNNTAIVDSYSGKPKQNRTALFTSFKYAGKKERWKINVGARKEIVSSTRYTHLLVVPIMPFAGADIALTKKMVLKSNVSRNYRLPAFNDLYWVPGGNINLQPEQGWSEEIGLAFIHKNKSFIKDSLGGTGISTINFSTTVFNRNIHNWILWVPAGNYWVPENVLKVWSRGIENTIDLTLNIHQIKFTTGLRFDYILSTNEKVPAGSENQLGKQLIYVPQYKGGLKVGGIYHGYSLSYTHNYTGIVYTQADDAAFVNGYWLGNMIFSKLFIKGNTGISLLFKINNIWNKSYQVIAYRAMPGRNFEIGISIQLNKL